MKLKDYFSKHERMLWGYSVLLIIVSFCLFDRTNYMTLCASLIGVTSLIFNAKGNPYNGNKAEVKVNDISKRENVCMWVGTFVVTILFYFILEHFNTTNIVPSTISVTTSFLAVYLTFRRSPYFALAYASNDVVLILLWGLASMSDVRYIAVVACFVAFLVNDIYGFVSWRKMKIRQQEM